MKCSLMLVALCLIAPAVVTGQGLAPATSIPESGPAPYVTIAANRAGIAVGNPLSSESAGVKLDSLGPEGPVGAHIRHTIVGGFLGALAGVAIGAGSGAWIDAHSSGDATFPASLVFGVYGGIAGLTVGLLTGAFWPVK